MTADDPRPAGEACQQSDWCGPGSHCLCIPAASGGATDGEREALQLEALSHGYLMDDVSAAGELAPSCACGGPCEHDGSLAREELFHTLYDLTVQHPMWIGGDGKPLDYLPERETRIGDFLVQFLALSAVQRLLADAVAVQRVRDVVTELERDTRTMWTDKLADRLRRALGGQQ